MAKKDNSTATNDPETIPNTTRKEAATKLRNESSLRTTPGVKTGRKIKDKKKIAHFLGFLQHAIAAHHCPSMWRVPGDRAALPLSQPDYWQVAAQVMERGLFDAMFIADVLAPYDTYNGNSDATVKWGVQCPVHEPATLVPIVACATKHLGIGVTLSNAFEHPYSMARRLSTLDHLSSGRVAWNIVSSFNKCEFDAYGRDYVPRGDRYDMLDEYLDVCYQLWDAWEPDAIVRDRESGIFADPAKVHAVNHDGKYYKCRGRPIAYRSPQVYPVLWQAGSSERGRDFAAKHAEAIFAILPTTNAMEAYSEDLNNRLDKFDRPSGSVKLIYGIQTVVDVTRERAQEKWDFIRSHLPLDAALTIMSGHMMVDFSAFDLDGDVKKIEVPGIQGVMDAMSQLKDGAPVTLREGARMYGASLCMPHAVGTAADVADQMEYYMDEGGADGFMLVSSVSPQCWVDIADLVVPEMQRRGRYRTEYIGPMMRDNLLQW